MHTQFPSQLADDELTLEVERLARCARELTAALVAHLAEFDERRLYRGLGYPSLFAYCTERLRLSEYGAYNRMEAARGETLPHHPRDAGRRILDPGHCAPPRAHPHGRKPPGAARGGPL